MKRVGFLYNHYAPHQVLHTAPVAFALSRLRDDVEVEVIASCERQLDVAERIGAQWPGHSVRFRQARQPASVRYLRSVGVSRHAKKSAVLRANRHYFRTLDALVVPERTSTALREFPELEHLQLIHIPHGAGDRAVGYELRNAKFDLLLVAGEKCRQRFIHQVGVSPHRIRVIGYPKFDVPPATQPAPLFPHERPVVLYNPHFDRALSSWPSWGEEVLDWFAGQNDYNLIFAPHVMLYRRAPRGRARLLRRYRGLPHMLLDTGSERCIDMTYTRAADVYLGDVSSQIYEFVRRPRPAVFLNAHGVQDWEGNIDYLHWRLGTVVDDPGELPRALQTPLDERMRERQRLMAARTFDEDREPAAVRGARAIGDFLEQGVARRLERFPLSAIRYPLECGG